MAFQQGLSGLKTSSQALDVISNNVANASTVGFKASQAQFADVYASSLQISGSGNVGIGARSAAISQQFTQGNLITTNNPLDIGINGKGFFAMQQGDGSVTYTRNGQFKLDKSGYITDASGRKLTGIMADENGTIVEKPASDQLLVSFKTGNPSATSSAELQLNLDSRSKTPVDNTHGVLLGPSAAPLNYSVTNRTFNIYVDSSSYDQTSGTFLTTPAQTAAGATFTIPITLTKDYSAAGGGGLTQLVADIQTQIDAYHQPSAVTVASSGSALKFTSNSTGRYSNVYVDTTAGSAGAAVLGSATLASYTAGTNQFSISAPGTYTSSTAMNVFDSLGNRHTMTYYFSKGALPNTWDVYVSFDGAAPTAPNLTPTPSPNPNPTNGLQIQFNSAGQMIYPTASTAITYAYNFNNGSTQLNTAVDLSALTQFGSSFSVADLSQNGMAPGELAGISVAKDGIVQARYDNGQTRNIGRIALFDFKNPNGLQPLGDNQWAETAESGEPTPGKPAVGIFGQLQASGVEESNVDLTAELVSMITQQRNYQANAQSIKTQDSIMQTLVNLR